jgi:hypothetical protein
VENNTLDKSIEQLDNIKSSTGPDIPFEESFLEISKNLRVSFLSLDPSESQIQLFHHGLILGGSWSAPSKQLIMLVGTEIESKPVQLVQRSIQDITTKSFSIEDFAMSLEGYFRKSENSQVIIPLQKHYSNPKLSDQDIY